MARKDLNRAKRKRTQSTSQQQPSKCKKKNDDAFEFNTVDYEALVATLTDEAMLELPPPPPPALQPQHQPSQPLAVTSNNNNYSTTSGEGSTQVHYYTYDVTPQTAAAAPSTLYYQQQQHQQHQQQHHHHHHPQSATKVISYIPSTTTTTTATTCTSQDSQEWEPRLLLRQLYKVSNQADAVVGLESSRDYRASIYLVNAQSCVNVSIDDLLSVQSSRVINAVDKFFFNGSIFATFYFDTILVEVTASGGSSISICNYTVKLPQTASSRGGGGGGPLPSSSPDVSRQTTSPPLQLTVKGWNDFKRLFNCIESYYRICLFCSPTIQSLITRYRNYFVKHYRNAILLTVSQSSSSGSSNSANSSLLKIPSGSYQHINVDLPSALRELDERRLPAATAEEQQQDEQPSLASSTLLLPWMDAEVRRFCAPNICSAVLREIKYDLIRL